VEVRHYPDPVLRTKTEAVDSFDGSLADLVQEMIATMRSVNGLGLAAPQVGISQRFAVVSTDTEPGHETVLVNPALVHSEGWEDAEEGCLSFPGIYIKIGRFARVCVRYHDLKGEAREMEAEGLVARAVQHELDHLDGRLLLDRMSAVQRLTHRRRLRELQDRYERCHT
jgi:peptide deformylase